MSSSQASLFAEPRQIVPTVKPWKPRALSHGEWPPNYKGVYAWRMGKLAALRSNPEMLASAKAYYSTRPAEFIQHWMDTYNPRIVGSSKWIPFVFFERQEEFIEFIEDLRRDSEGGLVEKCRDIGATWLACAYSVWSWLFLKDDATGWGSRKQELVHKIGDPDSIFEKMFLLIRRLPDVWLPARFSARDHATFMKLINPDNGSTVTGEAGDNIGRGGRKSRYWKDESAHYERAEKIEASLGDNTNVQIDISSVNGLGNVFHRRRKAGVVWTRGAKIDKGFTRVFIFDWRHHPEKDQTWYDLRRAKFEREGMLHIFAQEVDRDYSAAIENTIIPREWVAAAVDAHLIIPQLRVQPLDLWGAGLDVADEGMDRNAFALRQWVIIRDVAEWGARDPGVTAREAVGRCLALGKRITVEYDCIGVGASVKAEYNRLVDTGEINSERIIFSPWNAAFGVINPFERVIAGDDESSYNRDFFGNFKAQAWWSLRTRFYKVWRCIQAINQGLPVPDYKADELISLDGSMPLIIPLCDELAQPARKKGSLQLIVDKQPDGTKSPNLADAVVQAMFPVPDAGGRAIIGGYSA